MAVKGRGMEPLDPLEDFSNPAIAPGSPAADELTFQAEEIESEPTEESDIPEELADQSEGPFIPPQLNLEGVESEVPRVIRDGKMLAEFVRPHFSRTDDGERLVGFDFSFPLNPDHEEDGHLPSEVIRQWIHMREGNVKRTEVESIAPQTIAVNLIPGDTEGDLILVAATIKHPILTNIEVKGSGLTAKVIRFSFRAVVDQSPAIARFAVDHHGDSVWLSLQRTQGSLLEQN